jgi:manganese/iron transport system substrate-binding protein
VHSFSKTIFYAIALLSMLSAPTHAAETAKIKAVTSFTVIADIARNVAGDVAVVESITKPGAEIHDYQPTPKDIVRAKGADIIFWNGLNLERWFERFLLDIEDTPSVIVSEGITPLSIYEGPYTHKPITPTPQTTAHE